MPPEGCSTAPRSSHDPVEDGGEAEARGGGHGTALTRAGADGPRTGAGATGAGSADDQIGLLDASRHEGPIGADPAGSAAGTADAQIDFEQGESSARGVPEWPACFTVGKLKGCLFKAGSCRQRASLKRVRAGSLHH